MAARDRSDRTEAAEEQARRVARQAAQAGGIDVRVLRTVAEQRTAVDLVGEVWGAPGPTVLPNHIARAAERAGSYLAGAYAGKRLTGVCFGLLGLDDGRLVLHSHILGVAPSARAAGVGRALKLHQRAWAMERGIGEVTWTYDPLIVRNGYFNLTKLGAEAVAYHVDFYGPMDDGVNAGDDSDRVTVTWRLASGRVVSATDGHQGAGVAVPPEASAAPAILEVGSDGAPVERDAEGRPPAMWCGVPADIEALRRTRPELARRWRLALRQALGGALADGYTVPAATRDGWCLLQRGGA